MSNSSSETPDSFDRLDEMLSLMFDDQLTEEQIVELNQLLENDAEARQRSLDAAQIHADLYAYFNESKDAPKISLALPLPIPGMGQPANG